MKFGISLLTGADAPAKAKRAEANHFDQAMFIDSPMLFGDTYVTIAACAVQTERIALMPGVTNPVIRSAPITASALASLNAFAPGRIAIGIGVGFTGTGAMGLRASTLARLERYVGEVRGLLRGEVTEVAIGAGTIPMQFLNQRPPAVNLASPLQVYMAAAGPRAIELAGRIADGVILGGITQPDVIAACRDILERGARQAGRSAGAIEVAITPRVYLARDRNIGFEEAREVLGPKILGPAINFSRVAESSEPVPRALTKVFVAARNAYRPNDAADQGDPRTRHLRAYQGYTSRLQPWQVDLVTPELLDATTIVGTADECREKIGALAACGVDRVIVSPVAEQLDELLDVFGSEIIPRFAR